MIIIGVTGNIASGKSEVARLLAARGAMVIDADLVAHETYRPGTPGFEAVVAAFGPSVLTSAGEIDRGALGRIVFAAPEQLQRLTDIVWPQTRVLLEQRLQEAAASGASAVAIDAAILRQAGWHQLCTTVWLVHAPRAVVLERLRERNSLSLADAEARLDAQEASDPGLAEVDTVISNDADLDHLDRQVETAWQAALKLGK